MKIVELSIKDYREMVDKYSKNRLLEPPNIDPKLRNITVYNQSGPWTRFKNEYERLLDQWKNPPLPLFIVVQDYGDTICYKPKI